MNRLSVAERINKKLFKENYILTKICALRLQLKPRHAEKLLTPIRLDRNDGRKGGGVAIVLEKSVKFKLLPCLRTEEIEALTVELFTNMGPLIVTFVYVPGSTDPILHEKYQRDLKLLTIINRCLEINRR